MLSASWNSLLLLCHTVELHCNTRRIHQTFQNAWRTLSSLYIHPTLRVKNSYSNFVPATGSCVPEKEDLNLWTLIQSIAIHRLPFMDCRCLLIIKGKSCWLFSKFYTSNGANFILWYKLLCVKNSRFYPWLMYISAAKVIYITRQSSLINPNSWRIYYINLVSFTYII